MLPSYWLAPFHSAHAACRAGCQDNVPLACVDAVEASYLRSPTFTPEAIRSKSSAAAGLCAWVVNICKYFRIYQVQQAAAAACAAWLCMHTHAVNAAQQPDDAGALGAGEPGAGCTRSLLHRMTRCCVPLPAPGCVAQACGAGRGQPQAGRRQPQASRHPVAHQGAQRARGGAGGFVHEGDRRQERRNGAGAATARAAALCPPTPSLTPACQMHAFACMQHCVRLLPLHAAAAGAAAAQCTNSSSSLRRPSARVARPAWLTALSTGCRARTSAGVRPSSRWR